jgi:hypothetical protein
MILIEGQRPATGLIEARQSRAQCRLRIGEPEHARLGKCPHVAFHLLERCPRVCTRHREKVIAVEAIFS